MNQLKYANFRLLLDSKANSVGVSKTDCVRHVLSGMYKLTLLSKEGFVGLKKLQERLAQDLEIDTRKAVNKALQDNPIVNPRDEEYIQEVRSFVRGEIRGRFHR